MTLLSAKARLTLLALFLCTPLMASCFSSKVDHSSEERMDMSADRFFREKIQAEFISAIGRGELSQARALLAKGANVNAVGSEGMTGLYWAMLKRRIDGFRFLLENGANPDTLTRWEEKGREQWSSAIALSAKLEDSQYLRALLDAGANANQVVNSANHTAIYQAVLNRRTRNISLLLSHGADINHRSISSNTPIAEAVNMRAYSVALLLLRAGADPTIRDKIGFSAVETAKKFGDAGTIVGSEDESAYVEFEAELKRRGVWL